MILCLQMAMLVLGDSFGQIWANFNNDTFWANLSYLIRNLGYFLFQHLVTLGRETFVMFQRTYRASFIQLVKINGRWIVGGTLFSLLCKASNESEPATTMRGRCNFLSTFEIGAVGVAAVTTNAATAVAVVDVVVDVVVAGYTVVTGLDWNLIWLKIESIIEIWVWT